MKNYIKGGIYGAIFGGLMIGFFILSQYSGAYTSIARGDSFALRAMKDTSEIFLIPATPFMGWGAPIIISVIAVIIIYFLIGALVLGKYFKWREMNQPNSWFLKHFPIVLLLLIIIVMGFRIQSSWTEWGRWQTYLSCEKEYGIPGGVYCGGVGQKVCQESDLKENRREAMRIQCLKDRGYLNKSYPVGPSNPSQLGN